MENLIIKRESSDQECLKTDVSNSVKRIDYIKIEPEDGSDPKLIIFNCQTCETPIEPRLVAIKQEHSSPRKPIIKVEPSEITESINFKTCDSLALTSSTKSSNSISTSDTRCPDISNIKDDNSPTRSVSVKWRPISFDNLKRSDSPSLSSQKDSFYPFIPRRSFKDNRRFRGPSSQHNYKRRVYHPYRNYNHKNFNNSRDKYYHGRHKPWNNFPQHKRINKENNFILKNEEKPENALRIIKITSLNNPQEKTNANTLKEQNHPPADSPSTSSTLVLQSTNFHTNSSTILDKIHLETQCSNNLFSNEVNNNVVQQQRENSNESVFISSCEVNGSDNTNNCVKDLFEIQDAISVEIEDKFTDRSTKISKTLHMAYETGGDSRNACSDDDDETYSTDCCFIIANANESEVNLLIDKIYDSQYNTENVEEATVSINNIQFNEDGDKVSDIIVKEPESSNNREKEVNIDAEDDVDAEVEEMLKELEIEYEIINESEELNLSEDKTEIVELLQEAHTEVEVVKEINCDAEIECVFSKVKETHLCTRCFVEKRKRKRNKDTDVIFLSKKVSSKNIPVISIDEAEG